jgi:TorA maturation chaperone TorD
MKRKADIGSASIAAREPRAAAEVYGFLAGVFSSHPTHESVQALRRMADSLGIGCPESSSLGELDQEYMDLFIVPNPRYVAPYESVFRDEFSLPPVLGRRSNPGETGTKIKGLLMGESTVQARQAYLRAGVLPQEDLPDHIANELLFMAHLWATEAEADGEAPALANLRQQFCQEHLLQWIGQLRHRVGERDRIGFYRAALEVTEGVLRDDTEGDATQEPAVPSDPPPDDEVIRLLPPGGETQMSLPNQCGPRGCPFSGMGLGGHTARRETIGS